MDKYLMSHPRKSEVAEDAAHRRLNEEVGFNFDNKKVFGFYNEAKLENNIYEHEYDMFSW